jgi:hypothetical protein
LQESAAGVLITSKVMMVAQTRQHSLWEKELAERGGIEIASKVGGGHDDDDDDDDDDPFMMHRCEG